MIFLESPSECGAFLCATVSGTLTRRRHKRDACARMRRLNGFVYFTHRPFRETMLEPEIYFFLSIAFHFALFYCNLIHVSFDLSIIQIQVDSIKLSANPTLSKIHYAYLVPQRYSFLLQPASHAPHSNQLFLHQWKCLHSVKCLD